MFSIPLLGTYLVNAILFFLQFVTGSPPTSDQNHPSPSDQPVPAAASDQHPIVNSNASESTSQADSDVTADVSSPHQGSGDQQLTDGQSVCDTYGHQPLGGLHDKILSALCKVSNNQEALAQAVSFVLSSLASQGSQLQALETTLTMVKDRLNWILQQVRLQDPSEPIGQQLLNQSEDFSL